MFTKLWRRFFLLDEKPQPVPRMVADTPMNRENHFWKDYIGSAVIITSVAPDGLVDVSLKGQPVVVQGIDPARFT